LIIKGDDFLAITTLCQRHSKIDLIITDFLYKH